MTLADRVLLVPASKGIGLTLGPAPDQGMMSASIEVVRNGSGVRLVAYLMPEYENWRAGRAARAVAATGLVRRGTLQFRVLKADQVVLVVDNRLEGRGSAEVKVRANFEKASVRRAVPAKPGRARAVQAMGFFLFGLGLAGAGFLARR